MCFGDKKSIRSASPGAMPVLKIGSRSSTPAVQSRQGQPAKLNKLTKPRPQPVVMTEKSSSFDITWPLDRPDGDSDTIIYQPSSPDTLDQPPMRPFRYDENSVPPSPRAGSIYSRPESPVNEFTLPEKPLVIEPPHRSPTRESWRASSPLPPSPIMNPPNFSRPTSPPPALAPAPLKIARPVPKPASTAVPTMSEKRNLPLARSLSAKLASRPKFSLPENLAPFSMAPPPVMMDLYKPPSPPPQKAPPVPERTAPPERVFSPGRIAVTDDIEQPVRRVSYDKVKLFPIPDSIIQSGAGEAEQRHRTALASALAERAREKQSSKEQLERHFSKRSQTQRSSTSGGSAPSSHGSSSSQRDSMGSEEYDDFATEVGDRPSSMVPLSQLQSRFSMSSLGSTIRMHDFDAQGRPASARGGTGMPTFPSRHEAKKARKLWLQQQEDAKRQSAKMGVEGILGWDATKKQWVTKMGAEEMQLWLEQWKKGTEEKRGSAGSASVSTSGAESSEPKTSLDKIEVKVIHV